MATLELYASLSYIEVGYMEIENLPIDGDGTQTLVGRTCQDEFGS